MVMVDAILIVVTPVVAEHGLQSTGSVVVAHGFSCQLHVKSSRTRDQTCVPCIVGGFLTTGTPGKASTGDSYLTQLPVSQEPFSGSTKTSRLK